MVKVLIPRSDSVSVKIIEPSDSEKLLKGIVNDHVYSGFTVTASSGVNRSVDVSVGIAKIKGYHVENDADQTTAFTFGSDSTHFLYLKLFRDVNSEPERWDYTSNTTGVTPTDALMIAKVITSAGDVSSVDQTIEFKKIFHNFTFMGTGEEINALASTFPGMTAFCIKDGSNFLKDVVYTRNADNNSWGQSKPLTIFGTASDGDAIISATTTLSSNKNYNNLTVNSGVVLNTAGFIIRCFGTLTNQGTITDTTNNPTGGATATNQAGFAGQAPQIINGYNTGAGGGSGGGGAQNAGGGAGGSGGGVVIIYAYTLNNLSSIFANGTAGSNGGGNAGGGTAGGGGGGGGGTCFVAYRNLTQIGIIQANAGSGGTGGQYNSQAHTGAGQGGGSKGGNSGNGSPGGGGGFAVTLTQGMNGIDGENGGVGAGGGAGVPFSGNSAGTGTRGGSGSPGFPGTVIIVNL